MGTARRRAVLRAAALVGQPARFRMEALRRLYADRNLSITLVAPPVCLHYTHFAK
jgi:hypothetical protein